MRIGSKLFYLTQAATAYVLALFLWEIYTGGARPVEANPVAVYLALLGAYAADKEIGRWAARKKPGTAPQSRKGSWVVIFWVAFYGVIYGLHTFDASWHVPEGLAKLVLWVVGIFFGTGSSKRLFALLQTEGAAWASPELAAKTEAVRLKGEKEAEVGAILELIKANPQGLSTTEIAQGSGIPIRSCNRYLADLRSNKTLRISGKARGIRYFLAG